MEDNISRYLNNDIQRIIAINYRRAQKLEKSKKYKKAISKYQENIKKYNDSDSKIALARLYLDRKSGKIDNKLVRELLEDAYTQGNNRGTSLLGYVWANGIGGPKKETEACKLLLQELNNNNPDSMVYMELINLLPNDEKNGALKKDLKKSLTNYEKRTYNRKKSIDIFNNSLLGRVVNKIPNIVYVELEDFYKMKNKEKLSKAKNKLYDKACYFYNTGRYDTAKFIFRRLTNCGDKESAINYADMLSKGLGGNIDIATSKKIYQEILTERERKLTNIDKNITEMKKTLNKIKQKSKISRKDKKLKEHIKEEIEYLKYRYDKIMLNSSYNNALLKYGLLLVDNYQTQNELNEGIGYLKYFSDEGEYITEKNTKLSKYGKQHNKRARTAIHKLGLLYETKQWQPENIEEERVNFLKFSTGKLGAYTSYIAEKMNQNGKEVDSSNVNIYENSKECNFRYELGTLCELLHLNKFARKLYTSMIKNGDNRAANLLANMEQIGKGGKKDIPSAIIHYRNYIQSLSGILDRNEEKDKFNAVSNLASAMLEDEDTMGAIALYKISATKGIKSAKKALNELYKNGLWFPETKREATWIDKRAIKKSLGNIETNRDKIKKTVRNIETDRDKIKKPIIKPALAASIAAATAISATSYSVKNSTRNVQEEESYVSEYVKNGYTIGDEVTVLSNKNSVENLKVIGVVAYNTKNKEMFPTSEYNINNLGLTSDQYLEEVSKNKNVSKDELDLLYCLKNSSNEIIWVNPKKESINLLNSYSSIKKEDNVHDLI